MPYFVEGDPNPRKTPAELEAEEAARPVTKKIADEAEQISMRETNGVWAALGAFLILLCAIGAAIAARGCT